jgi:putative tryptophan/tyrosine transport system substrate-binding protein
MDRRTFIASMVGAVLSAPLAAKAQQGVKFRRIGFLRSGPPPESWVEGLQQGLRDLGYVEGKNIITEFRFTDGSTGKLPDLVAELLRLKVEVIVASGTPATLAAQNLTRTVPIVVVGVNDPVGSGLVSSLSRPGENITGLTNQTPDLAMKRVGLLKEVVPQLSRLAVLGNPAHPAYASQVKTIETGVRSLGVQLDIIAVRSPNDFEAAFKMARRAQALIQLDDVLLPTHRTRLLELTRHNRLPAVYGFREFVDGGGLMAYGVNFPDLYRRAAIYVDKILKGAKPADLPVEQPTKFELVINMKTAKALGLTIPPSLLQRTDEVIQ